MFIVLFVVKPSDLLQVFRAGPDRSLFDDNTSGRDLHLGISLDGRNFWRGST